MQTNSHLSRLIYDQAEKYGDREVLIYKDFGGSEWKSYSWNQFSDMGCPRCHHPLLCHQLRTADPVYDQRREDKIPLRGRAGTV